jgi:hypothetical protein
MLALANGIVASHGSRHGIQTDPVDLLFIFCITQEAARAQVVYLKTIVASLYFPKRFRFSTRVVQNISV